MQAAKRWKLLLLAAIMLVAGAAAAIAMRPASERPAIGLFSTLPIYWAESHDMAGFLNGDAEPHWARALIEQHYAIRPLDALVAADATSPDPLAGLAGLVMAQPRVLAPSENVALDDWVRRGGQLLLFADPMLTAHTDYSIGDKRRPQDVILISPLLNHWGLKLEFDESQPLAERSIAVNGINVPVQLAGRLVPYPSGKGGADCRIAAEGVVANCTIGKGRAMILADAHLLDGEMPEGDSREPVLEGLLEAGISQCIGNIRCPAR